MYQHIKRLQNGKRGEYMATGFLYVQVFADNRGQPIPGAIVTVSGEKYKKSFSTDISGETEVISLESPPKDYSLRPQDEVRPYSVYDISVEKPGLESQTIKAVEIFEGITSFQEVFLRSASSGKEHSDVLQIDENALWENYPPKIEVLPADLLHDEVPQTRVLTYPIIPEFVIVHDGLPTNTSAPNYYVSYTDYIKNVACSEIYPTWPLETLRANIYAIQSLTISRIYSEWYLSQGYNFTITSSTQFDQKFIYGRNIFVQISNVVDEIFNKYIKRVGENYPFFSQYNDGIKVNNIGWLSQWGSKDLGDKGFSALNILKYYYGYDVFLDSAEIYAGIPTSFPGYNLTVGICGQPVQKVQAELNFIRNSYPYIPKILSVDGNYGPNTKLSVQAFQEVFKIPVTGVVDFATWYRISYIFVAVSKMLAGRYKQLA